MRRSAFGFGNQQPAMSCHRVTSEQATKVAARPACNGSTGTGNYNGGRAGLDLGRHQYGANARRYEVYEETCEEEYETYDETYEVQESSFEEEVVAVGGGGCYGQIRRGC